MSAAGAKGGGESEDVQALGELRRLRDDFTRFVMAYKFGVDEVRTKISILQEEFTHLRHYNPIEHVSSRVKTPESILDKAQPAAAGSPSTKSA
ncbi:ppGpp synthetase/RelA/SpoT-type nucleotidyltransferase [Paenarthrobacter nicotinovorans]|uniref:PpGpp synthetase/RelA/SpoT-type nucleotidyltransferase n=1 Tax=Paenarthrobacter nicotinovorans TaxID=29320 RepID=A0ABT9TM59_PAENI|nr:hypothetical protein [Paenarthrobacter nicotinovorans]MDQ0102131.1 ppGpp synthetase/RelA/SpoT-type nucleotidyltransferase [Paenarthrobacter nicotinovorans]GAT88001.1 GTP pyrophosphokinase [Paenarthrobacter nicotinovorans]